MFIGLEKMDDILSLCDDLQLEFVGCKIEKYDPKAFHSVIEDNGRLPFPYDDWYSFPDDLCCRLSVRNHRRKNFKDVYESNYNISEESLF